MSYDFNKQVSEEGRSSIPKQGIYLDDIKFLRMTPKNANEDILFKILPAFDPQRSQVGPAGNILVDPQSWVPFRDTAGNLTPWGRYIHVAPFTGHGKEGKGGNRRELISLKSFSDDPNVYDPLTILLENIASDPVWKYLTEDRLDQDVPKGAAPVVLERKAINAKLAAKLLCNIVELRKKEQGVFLAEFSSSTFDSLFAEGGLALARNLNATEEDIARNPMLRWYVGDLTDMRETGPCLKVLKDPNSDRGKYAGYVIQVAFNAQKNPYRVLIEPEYLPYRYNLMDLSTIIKKPTEEELVNTFVALFNQWSPNRQYHEYELLKQAFGHNFRIPDAPARGQGVGFGPSPEQGFGRAPQQGFQPGKQLPGTQVPGLGAQQQAPQSQFQGAPVDFGGDDIPMGTMQPPVTKMAQQQQQFSARGPQVPVQQFRPQQPSIQQQGQQFQQPGQQPVPQSAQQPTPQQTPIPGDPVQKFDRNVFLSDIKSKQK